LRPRYEVMARLGVLASSQSFRVGSRQIEMIDYPDEVTRELVANAFAHRDWERRGTIEITHTPEDLTISSPGALLPTLHADRLLRETAQRNRMLSSEIARLRLAEGAGLGFDRVWRSLALLGKPPPVITSGPDFVVTVAGGHGDTAFARYVQGSSFPARFAGDLDVLLTLTWLRTNRTVRANDISLLLQRDETTAQRTLQRLFDVGLLEPTRATARNVMPTYRLPAPVRSELRGALSYRVESIDSDDEKLLRHLSRHGRISNQDVRDYLDCDVPTARNRLQRMRRKGWIAFDPNGPRRGANVQYVARHLPA
jgi:ATP-dependent DNA helicase RecG